MLEFKSKKVRVWFGILLVIALVVLGWVLFFDAYNRHLGEKSKEPYHNLTLYNSEGDTILNMDTEASSVKIWIEENGGLDVYGSVMKMEDGQESKANSTNRIN